MQLSLTILLTLTTATMVYGTPAGKTSTVTVYNACPNQKFLQCCTGALAGTGGVGAATGTGCISPTQVTSNVFGCPQGYNGLCCLSTGADGDALGCSQGVVAS